MTLPYTPALIPEDEAWRLRSLHDLSVLDTAPEAEFDALVKVASMVCGVPISLISLVDADRQWFKADVGLGATQTPRDVAFCAHAILGEQVFEVDNALEDPRFAGNPLVQGAPDIRFYAGAPITLANGARVGTLCVIDREPKTLTPMQREVLQHLGVAAAQALEARKLLLAERNQAVIAAHDEAVQSAKTTQQRLESALQQASALATTIDIHAITSEADRHGVITSCNDAFERISGYSREELIGRNHNIVNSGTHDKAFWDAMWSTISSGMPWRGEICNRTKAGQVYWVDSMIAPFIGNDGLVEKYVSIRTDITDRVIAEQQREALRQRFTLATESAGIGVWEWDLSTNALTWDDQIYKLYQRPRDAANVPYTVWRESVHPADIAESEAQLALTIRGEKDFDRVFRIAWPSGEIRYIHAYAKPVRDAQGSIRSLVGVNFDVTEINRARDALISNKMLLDESQSIAKVGGWELNLQTGVLFWTDETYRIHETSPDTFNPTVDAGVDYFLPESRRIISEALDAAISRGQGYDLALETYTTKGSLIDVRTTCAVTMEGGKAVKLTGIFQDITERKRNERALQAARVEAEFAAQSKGQFLANMSHEIRTPMNAILGLLNLLQSTELTDRQRDYASKTEGAAQSLLGLLNDILDFSKVEAGKMTLESEPFGIDKLLRNLSVVLSANVGSKNIEVLFDIDTTLPSVVRGDAMRLQQVLINLGGNAVKFTSQGQVVVSLRKIAQTDAMVRIEFAVQDSGIGIAPEHQAHIFSGFSQAEGSTTRRFGGTGLGLAISKRFVELMGGNIEITSTLGEGSTFAFTLEMPLVDEVPETLQEPQRTTEGPQRVLVVDDNPIAGELTLRLVRSWGWAVDWAHSGEEALHMVSAQCAEGLTEFPYPLVYMDWKMPGLDGWETTRQMRDLAVQHQTAQPLVVMITAHGREMLSQRTEDEQAMINGFLVKPVTASMLSDAWIEAGTGKSSVRKLGEGRSRSRQLTGMRILVVEDNLINQQVADELLSAEGAIVSLAANGQIGVEAVAGAAPQFDVVLMDVQMPVLDGYGATRAIREDLGLTELLIVAMTANAMASDRDACMAAGMNDHIGKPFDMAKLVSLLVRMTGFETQASAPHPSPQSYGQAQPLPVIDGLDLYTAVSRMSGMRSLYVRTARDFVKIMDTIIPELQLCLSTGDKAKAMMRLHTLKGNAGTLGASELAAKAAKLEVLCKTGAGLKECEQGLARFEVLVRSTQVSLKEAIARMDTNAPPRKGREDSAALAPLDKPARDALSQLTSLCAESNLEALQFFAESRELLEALPIQTLDSLDEAFQSLDLEAAHALCARLLTELAPRNSVASS